MFRRTCRVIFFKMRRHGFQVLSAVWAIGTLFFGVAILIGTSLNFEKNIRPDGGDLKLPSRNWDDPVLHRRELIRYFKEFKNARDNRTGWDKYLKYRDTGTRVWPMTTHENTDRILNQIHSLHVDKQGAKLKKILMRNGFETGMLPGQQRFLDHGCPVNQCALTGNQDDAATADLILFKDTVSPPTTRRPRRQIWILFMLESPQHTASLEEFNNMVNWTATYRTDSTLVTPYERFSYFANVMSLPEKPSRNYASGKTKKVAWFVSNCGAANGRYAYATELANHIGVDIYGSCGSMMCPRNADECNKILKKDYKFYLAFENSNCKDYITEKLYWNALLNDIVPVVMGARPEDYERLAPPQSYIHVDDFESPKHLADYLHKLDQDDDLYNSYFRWKGTGDFIDTKFWCRLCSMLHEAHHTDHHMTYHRLEDWWRGPGVCVAPRVGMQWATWRNASPPFDEETACHSSWRQVDNLTPNISSTSQQHVANKNQ